MKSSMNDSNSSSDDANNHHNWLGFSLSPHMKMEVTTSAPSHHHHNHHPSSPSSFYLSPSSHITAMCYAAAVGDNVNAAAAAASFHSPLTVMPLKSDGSLCIMEALSRSHQTPQVMVPSSSPKLEDFLGGASMGTHEEREAMALSLDSIYYSSQNAESHQVNRDHSLDLFAHPYYSGLGCHAMYQEEQQQQHKEALQMPPGHMSGEEGIDCFKNWVEVNCGSMRDDGGGELQTLSLSMSPGSQSSCVTVPAQISPSGTDSVAVTDGKKRGSAKLAGQKQPVHRKSIDTFGQRTSQYRGVTRHRWTGRYEAHLWDNSCKKEGQTRKGRQVYLGGYDMEEKAARAYDLAALKYWGPSTHINFPLENYQAQLEEMKNMTRQEYVAHLRRKSSGFSRGASMYRGVTRHHQHGRWQARIGRVAGNKDLYLGTFSTQEEAAEAYDVAAIKFRGVNAVTNFDISRYDVERIMASNTLLAGEMARRNKDMEPPRMAEGSLSSQQGNNNVETVEARNKSKESDPNWTKMVLFQEQQESNNVCGNYRSPAFSVALQDLIGIDSVGSGQPMVEDSSNKINGTHFSNPSSLVTSLSSSREASPDKMGPTMLFPKPPTFEAKISNNVATNPITSVGVSSWFPSQMRPASAAAAAAISLSHLPVFAAWNDA